METSPNGAPWHGILVATALPLRDDLAIDHDRFADHVRFLAEAGCHGVAPTDPRGHQTLTPQERAAVVTTAVAAAPDGFRVVPGGCLRRARGPALTNKRRGRSPPASCCCPQRLPRRRRGGRRPLPRVARSPTAWRTTTRSTRSTSRRHYSRGHREEPSSPWEFTGDVRAAYRSANPRPDSTSSAALTTSCSSSRSRARRAGSPAYRTRCRPSALRCGTRPVAVT